MSGTQKGRPTIYGVDQPKRRSGYPRTNQANRAREASGRRSTEEEQGSKKGTAEQAGGVRMEPVDGSMRNGAPDSRARMEQMPRRYVPGMDARSMQTGERPAERRMDMEAGRNREAHAMSNTGKQAEPGVRRQGMEPGRKRGEYSGTATQGRRRESGTVYTTDAPGRRKDAGISVYQEPPRRGAAAPSQRATRDWEEMPERDEMHRTDFASDRKLRALWSVFGILAVLLVAAIIYEVVLGNGLKETGNQRMAGQTGTQTTTQTNAPTTAQTSAATDAAASAADSASTTQTTAQTSASTTPDVGTVDAADGADVADGAENDSANDAADDSADGSADDAVDDIPTISIEGDGVQADAAE